MDIIAKRRDFFQLLSPHLPTKLIHLFTFGYDTLVAKEIVSTRTNARQSRYNRHTAKSKMYRLLKNQRLLAAIPELVTKLHLVADNDTIAVDFSDFGQDRQVLMFAKQTKQGRALPLYFEVLEYPIEKDSQNLFVVAAIKRFYKIVNCMPTLVFDRGFACPSIIDYLAQNRHRFIIRIKKRKQLRTAATGHTVAAEEYTKNDLSVTAYGHTLRLIRSHQPENENDPWYLITNDTESTRAAIINQYYHRFEIEEFFRDAKRLLRLEWVHCRTSQSFSMLLWFALITTWLFACITETLTDAQEAERKQWKLSQFRYVFECLQRELYQLAEMNVSGLARAG